jgi:histidinol-phosphatase (PHP family)
MQIEDLEAQFDAYIVEAHRLKSKYAGQIDLLVGLETENIGPASLDKLDALLQHHSASIEYLVGSVHHVNGFGFDFDRPTFQQAVESFPPSDDTNSQLDRFFCAYFDAQYDLLERVKPEVIGHFDLCRLWVPDASFAHPTVWQKVQRNVALGVSYGALFELNAAAFRKGWTTSYPGKDVLEVCGADTPCPSC